MDKDLKKLAIELRDEFNEAADQLDEHAKNVNIARVAGGSAAVAGGALAIIGLGLAPFTFGSSAAVAAVAGAVLGGVGGLAAGGASVAKGFIESNKLEPLLKKWSDFTEKMKKELHENEPEICEKVKNELQRAEVHTTGTAAASRTVVKDGIKVAGRTGAAKAAAEGAVAAEGAAARLVIRAAAGSILLNVVLVGFSLYDIIDGSIELHKETGSQAGDYLRHLAQSLDDFVRDDCTEVIIPSCDD